MNIRCWLFLKMLKLRCMFDTWQDFDYRKNLQYCVKTMVRLVRVWKIMLGFYR